MQATFLEEFGGLTIKELYDQEFDNSLADNEIGEVNGPKIIFSEMTDEQLKELL
jgi:hypothetical protein